MENKLSKSWLIWGIAAFFYLYEMVLRVSPSVMTDSIMMSFGVTSTMLGVLVSFYYYAYTVLQIPCGFILDKLGPRSLIGLSAILCSVGSMLFAITEYIYIAQIGRFLVGAGSACAFVSCLQIASSMFPPKYFALLAGVTNMMGTLGGLFGGVPIAKAVNTIGWQHTTYYLAFIGLIIAILTFIFVPRDIKQKKDNEQKLYITATIVRVASNPQVILAGLVAGFMYLPISAFSELWAIPFFMTKYGVNNETASIASAILFLGVAFGSVFLAFVAHKIGGYLRTIKFSAILLAVLFVPLIYCNISLNISFVIVFFIGLFTGAQVINFTCAKNHTDSKIAGTTIAFTNAIVMLIGSIFQPILGLFLDIFWTGKISEMGTRMYDISCYQNAVLTLPMCLLIAFIISMFMKETINTEH